MERVFKAKEEMIFNLADGDGFTIEEDGFVVPKDSIWYWNYNDKERVLSSVQLISEDLKQWLEIDIDVLELEFEEIK